MAHGGKRRSNFLHLLLARIRNRRGELEGERRWDKTVCSFGQWTQIPFIPFPSSFPLSPSSSLSVAGLPIPPPVFVVHPHCPSIRALEKADEMKLINSSFPPSSTHPSTGWFLTRILPLPAFCVSADVFCS